MLASILAIFSGGTTTIASCPPPVVIDESLSRLLSPPLAVYPPAVAVVTW